MKKNLIQQIFGLSLFALTLVGCGGGGGGSNLTGIPVTPPPPPPPDPITITGVVQDGPVVGGTVYAFDAEQIGPALEAANEAEDRAASLAAAESLGMLTRADGDESLYTLEVSGDFEGDAVFVIFDNEGAEDMTFGDQPFNLESVAILGDAGETQTVNITPHTSMIAQQVRLAVDPESSGTPIDASAITDEINLASANVIAVFGKDEFGETIFEEGTDIVALEDEELLERGSNLIGMLVRSTASASDIDEDDVLTALAYDAADGELDGQIPASVGASDEAIANADAVDEFQSLGEGDDIPIVGGSCAAVAELLGRSCDIDIMDDFLEGKATCQDTSDEEEFEECIADVEESREEDLQECGAITDERIELCDDLEDAVYDSNFGEAFAANFVDPRDIGDTVEPNPYFPLVAGNQWVYAGTFIEEDDDEDDDEDADDDDDDEDADDEEEEGELVTETITVTVTDKVKLIQGILCVVVNDKEEVDGEVVEETDDWFAQDMDGNVWYCGEISREFEFFDDEDPELVEIEGSWKAGRESAKAGILLPAEPVVEDIFRQEQLFGEAEDISEIVSVTGTESSPAASCDGNCLVTFEYTPLEPEAEEYKYYLPGTGLIVEVDLETDNRIELQSFTNINQ